MSTEYFQLWRGGLLKDMQGKFRNTVETRILLKNQDSIYAQDLDRMATLYANIIDVVEAASEKETE